MPNFFLLIHFADKYYLNTLHSKFGVKLFNFIRETNVKISLKGAELNLLPVALNCILLSNPQVHQIMVSILKYLWIDKNLQTTLPFFSAAELLKALHTRGQSWPQHPVRCIYD